MLSSAMTTGLIVGIISIVPVILSRLGRNKSAKRNDQGEKYFDVSRFWFWFVYIAASSFCAVGVGVIFLTDEPWAGVGFVVMGAILGLPMVFIDMRDSSIEWTADYIRGPKSEWSGKKSEVQMVDLATIEYFGDNKGFKLFDKSGKTIYWSWAYSGWEPLVRDILAAKPDINTIGFDAEDII